MILVVLRQKQRFSNTYAVELSPQDINFISITAQSVAADHSKLNDYTLIQMLSISSLSSKLTCTCAQV